MSSTWQNKFQMENGTTRRFKHATKRNTDFNGTSGALTHIHFYAGPPPALFRQEDGLSFPGWGRFSKGGANSGVNRVIPGVPDSGGG
jgi:hypothetical protein